VPVARRARPHRLKVKSGQTEELVARSKVGGGTSDSGDFHLIYPPLGPQLGPQLPTCSPC
jgi:hypothetical protein